MITKAAIIADVERWFAEPASVVAPSDTFHGVVVFERPGKRGQRRLAVAAGESLKQWWDRSEQLLAMPFTAQPSKAWSQATAVGFASTKEEALSLLFPNTPT